MEEKKSGPIEIISKVEEIKPVPENEGLISQLIGKLKDKVWKIKADETREKFANTKEGQRLEKLFKEMEESNKKGMERWVAVYGERLLQAKKELCLSLFADELIKKYDIKDDDPRLSMIMTNQDAQREVIAAAFYKK